jgi:hypothetical protein
VDFFADVDALGIAETHIQQLQELEERQSKRILASYRVIRHELRERLRRLPPGSFSAQQARGTLYQIETAIRKMNDSLLQGMYSAAYDIAGQGVEDLAEEIKAFEKEFRGAVVPINVRAAAIATETQNYLLPKYEASIKAYGDDLIEQMGGQLATALISQDNLYKTTADMARAADGFFAGEEWKLLRIARTELHNVYGAAKVSGMMDLQQKQMPDLKKALIHPIDSRTAQDSLYLKWLNPIMPISEPFIYEWPARSGKIRVFQHPPDRPNDRAILVPYRDSWAT